MRDNCDKCGSPIEKGTCSCGRWFERGETPPLVTCIEEAILAYNELRMKDDNWDLLSGCHHSGSSFVFFRGGEKRTELVREYIKDLDKEKE